MKERLIQLIESELEFYYDELEHGSQVGHEIELLEKIKNILTNE